MPTAADRRTLASLAVFLAAAPGIAQNDDASALVAALERDETRAVARARLLALGGHAVSALAAGIENTDTAIRRTCVDLLVELGPVAESAVPGLLERFASTRYAGDCLEVLVELIPFRPAACAINETDWRRSIQRRVADDVPQRELMVQRWRLRSQFPQTLDTGTLAQVAAGIHPLRIEVAIDLLGSRAAAAGAALSVLSEIMSRPEPRILSTDQALPLHRKAARAILAISPTGALAAKARRVIDGEETVTSTIAKPVPEKLQQRLDELVADLAIPDRRTSAIQNLVALGESAAAPVAATVRSAEDPATVLASADVLRQLGSKGVIAVPDLFNAIRRMPTDCTIAILEALIATAPWCPDVLPGLRFSGGSTTIEIMGARIPGVADDAFWNDFHNAGQAYALAIRFDPTITAAELALALEDDWVLVRERALVVAAERGVECRPLLGHVEVMLTATQPPCFRLEQAGSRTQSHRVERTAHVQRLAAQAIIAIAPADDLRVAAARKVLELPEPR